MTVILRCHTLGPRNLFVRQPLSQILERLRRSVAPVVRRMRCDPSTLLIFRELAAEDILVGADVHRGSESASHRAHHTEEEAVVVGRLHGAQLAQPVLCPLSHCFLRRRVPNKHTRCRNPEAVSRRKVKTASELNALTLFVKEHIVTVQRRRVNFGQHITAFLILTCDCILNQVTHAGKQYPTQKHSLRIVATVSCLSNQTSIACNTLHLRVEKRDFGSPLCGILAACTKVCRL